MQSRLSSISHWSCDLADRVTPLTPSDGRELPCPSVSMTNAWEMLYSQLPSAIWTRSTMRTSPQQIVFFYSCNIYKSLSKWLMSRRKWNPNCRTSSNQTAFTDDGSYWSCLLRSECVIHKLMNSCQKCLPGPDGRQQLFTWWGGRCAVLWRTDFRWCYCVTCIKCGFMSCFFLM